MQSAEQVFRWLLGSLWLLALFFFPYDFWSLGQVSGLWQRRSLLDAWMVVQTPCSWYCRGYVSIRLSGLKGSVVFFIWRSSLSQVSSQSRARRTLSRDPNPVEEHRW